MTGKDLKTASELLINLVKHFGPAERISCCRYMATCPNIDEIPHPRKSMLVELECEKCYCAVCGLIADYEGLNNILKNRKGVKKNESS